MSSWEEKIARYLRALQLDSIRNKILVFAVLATLIPSLTTAWLSYTRSKRSVDERIRENLQSVSSQIARELDLWWKERLFDLRVFSSSYEVSENLERISRTPGDSRAGPALARITDYLKSVRERFPDYEALLVLDAHGRIVARSARQQDSTELPADWLQRVRAESAVVGDAHRDEASGKTLMRAAVPVHGANGRFLGALTVKLNLRAVDGMVKRIARTAPGEVYLVGADGAPIITSRFAFADPMPSALPPDAVARLFEREGEAVEYTGLGGRPAVGALRRVPRVGWGVVAEIAAQEAYRQAVQLRNLTVLIVLALLLGVGSIAYLLGTLIVRPLDRLAKGAAKVATGNLDVDLPVVSGGEVGDLTEVFNNMVARLREKNEELERLSVTDGLTGLYNRRYLMHALANEVRRSERHAHPFALLMLDIDRFKDYNDRFGHLAGDEVLTRLASVLRGSIRDVDLPARYGGEEFVAVLPETDLEDAVEIAERIRSRLAEEALPEGNVTLSIGVAEFPDHGDTPESLLASADAALYRAKREGRNRVVAAEDAAAKRARDASG